MTNITIASETELLDQMTTPTPEVEAAVARLDGEILLLGVGGKMGPSLAELLVRAGAQKVIGVVTASSPGPSPAAKQEPWRAAVPELKATA